MVIHGSLRKADDYFASMMKAAKAGAGSNILVLAPNYKTSADRPGSGEARWTLRGGRMAGQRLAADCPGRSKASDGSIGNAVYASRDSDHNPWDEPGTVTAPRLHP
jgi:hypothetical protein